MSKFKEKMIRFFSGRYGLDAFGKCLFAVYLVGLLVMTVVEFFVYNAITFILRLLLFILAIYMIYRVMSRNIVKRQIENRRFLAMRDKLYGWFRLQRDRFRDRKTHVFRKCPSCKAVLRLKRIKGDHRAACPRCGKSFDVHV